MQLMLPQGEMERLDLASQKKPGGVATAGLGVATGEAPVAGDANSRYLVCTALMSASLPLPWQIRHCSVFAPALGESSPSWNWVLRAS